MPGGVAGEDGDLVDVTGEAIPIDGKEARDQKDGPGVTGGFNPSLEKLDEELANQFGRISGCQ